MSESVVKPVAQVCLSPSWGGLEMCTVKHALWFREAGHPVVGVALKGSPLEQAFLENDFPVLSLTARGYFSWGDSMALRRFLVQHGVKTICSHHLKDLWRIRLALVGLRGVEVVGFARMFLKNVNKKDFLHRWVYGCMKTLVSLTQIQKEALLNCLPVRSENVAVIPDGVNVDEFHPSKRSEDFRARELRVQAGEIAIGLVGRIDPQKGSREFIEAAIELCALDARLKFLLIGKETPDTPGFEQSLKDLIAAADLTLPKGKVDAPLGKSFSERILFLGHRRDVDHVIANLDVFVMPSYEETFGDVLIEAMACEVPSVATRAGGPINIIDEGINGILVPPKEVEPLKQAIWNLITHPDLARRLAVAGRKKALNVYDERKVFSQIKALI